MFQDLLDFWLAPSDPVFKPSFVRLFELLDDWCYTLLPIPTPRLFGFTGAGAFEACEAEISGLRVNSGSINSPLPDFISWIYLKTTADSFCSEALGMSYLAFTRSSSQSAMSWSFSCLSLLLMFLEMLSGLVYFSHVMPYRIVSFGWSFTILSAVWMVLFMRKALSIWYYLSLSRGGVGSTETSHPW